MVKLQRIHPVYKIAAKLLLAVSLLAFVIHKLEIRCVLEMIVNAKPALLALAILLLFLRPTLGACRWRVLLNARTQAPNLPRMIRHYLVGSFFGFFLPATAGSDLARGYGVHRDGADATASAGSVIVERWLGLSCLLWLAFISACFAGKALDGLHLVPALLIVVLMWMVLLLAFLLKSDQWLEKILPSIIREKLSILFQLADEIRSYTRQPRKLGIAVGYTLLIHLVGITNAFLVSQAIGCSTHWLYFVSLLPIIWIISMIPISLNGLGVREGTFIVLFHVVGMDTEAAGAGTLFLLAQSLLLALIGGLLFVTHKPVNVDLPKERVPA